MRYRPTTAAAVTALVAALVLPASASAAPATLRLSEIRIDQPSGDTDEYAELSGTPDASLDGVTYVVLGDGTTGSGTVEAVVPLDGQTIGTNGFFLLGEESLTLATPDLVANLNFENSDNVTHLLVDGFEGAAGDDLDTDDDGTLDAAPWSTVLDAVGLVEDPDGGEAYYGAALGFVDVGPDGSYVPGRVFRDVDGVWTIGSFSDLGQDTPTPGAATGTDPEPETCTVDDDGLTLISAIQGPGAVTPLPVFPPDEDGNLTTREVITIEAVVTFSDPDLDGFFVQEEPDDADDTPDTSEGLFVFDFRADQLPPVGATVQVTDRVNERYGLTQMAVADIEVCDVAPTTIEPTELELPASAEEREQLEGMLVTTVQELDVTALFAPYAYGELGLTSMDAPLPQPTSLYAPEDPEAQALLEEQAASFIKVDDRGEFGWDRAPWSQPADGIGPRPGDTVAAGITGPLTYTHDEYKIEPAGDGFPTVIAEGEHPRPDVPVLADGNDVVAFNVLNYFNTFGDSAVLRGATNARDFEVQTAKIVAAMLELDAAVYGLVEIENDYEEFHDDDPTTVPAVVTLVEALNEATAPGTFAWVEPDEDQLTDEGLGGGGLGTDAIAQALIYRPSRATPVGPARTFDIDALLEGDSENNRWPLAQTFRLDGEFVEVVVNHLKSKGSSCTDVDGPAFDLGDDVGTALTGNCNLTREYAVRRLVEWVQGGASGFPTDDTLLLGDFNSYEEEGPIELLVEAGFTDLVEQAGDDAFTYRFDGRYGRLDYAFASPSLAAKVADAAVWQANSLEFTGNLYDGDPVDRSAYASSDHDPVIVSLSADDRNGADGRGTGRADRR